MTRHKSPNGAIRTAQHRARDGQILVGYGFEGDTFVMHWSSPKDIVWGSK